MTTSSAAQPGEAQLPSFTPGDAEVLQALLRRKDEGSRPGERNDPHRIALVVSGGGMRGAYLGGMAHALEQAGLGRAFDDAYGTSVGAYVSAGLLTGQAWRLGGVFGDHMTSREFIDFRRLGTRRPVVSLDYLMDYVFTVAEPVRWDDLVDCRVRLRVIATAADDMRPQALHGFDSARQWQLALRATACIPYFAGPPIALDGRRWLDGSVTEPMPVLRALRDGATHVLVLSSRTQQDLRPAVLESRWRSPLCGRSLDQLAPGLGGMATGIRHYATNLNVVRDAAHPHRGDAHLLAITPSRSVGIGGLSTKRDKVHQATELGYASVSAALRALRAA